MKIKRGWLAAIIIVCVILLDQLLKIWVKTNFFYGEEYMITEWFRLFFIENNGMAFGMEFGSKLLLTWFRIIAVSLFIYYIYRIKDKPFFQTFVSISSAIASLYRVSSFIYPVNILN